MRMNMWVGLVIGIAAFSGGHAARAQNKSKSPTMKVVCNVMAAEITLTYHSPDGDKSAKIGDAAIPLKPDHSYSLLVMKPGYTTYQKRFKVNWEGQKIRRVILEKGIGPDTSKPWVVDLEDSVTMEFMPIPAGEFRMGSEEGEGDEEPVQLVAFSRPFWMAKTEVTYEQYQQYKTLKHEYAANDVVMQSSAKYPAIWLSWKDAMAFCNWLTKEERLKGRLPEGYRYTLPTEAEWEYACRAGSAEAYAGNLDTLGWYRKNSGGKTNPVGRKSPNAWGLYDMHGNVWEWCTDVWYADYRNAPVNGSQRGLAENEYQVDKSRMSDPENSVRLYNPNMRVIRGGAWNNPGSACRSANRYYHEPDTETNYLGFRPVLLWYPPALSLQVTRKIGEE